jgi:hypothetical protein
MDELLTRRKQAAWAVLGDALTKCPEVARHALAQGGVEMLEVSRHLSYDTLSLADYWIWWPASLRVLGAKNY